VFTTVSERSGHLAPCAGNAHSFEPTPLPPDLSLNPEQWRQVADAEFTLGQLQGHLDQSDWPQGLIRLAALQEAVASSQLEGWDLSLRDALWWQLDGSVDELRSRAGALRLTHQHADLLMETLQAPDRQDLRELHARLYRTVQGREAQAGQLRSSLIWLGPRGTTAQDAPYVPPAPAGLPDHIRQLEVFQKTASHWPRLVLAGLLYYQIETLHPFLDGSGRLARSVMIHILGGGRDRMATLLLRPSRLWQRSTAEHFRQLQSLREHGDYETWIAAFAGSIKQSALEAISLLGSVTRWQDEADQKLLEDLPGQRKVGGHLFRFLPAQPIVDVSTVAERCGRNFANANILMQRLVEIGLLQEITGRRRNRRYVAPGLIDVLGEGLSSPL
jgi:Fic family protein